MYYGCRITQHKRFVSYSAHSNPSLMLRTSFVLGTLGDISVLTIMEVKDYGSDSP